MPAHRRPAWLRRPLPLLALVMTTSLSRATPPTDVSTLLEPVCTNSGVPGMVAVVLRGDQIVAQGAAGVRAAGSKLRITIDDRFHLGSDTKAMTATLLAVLIEEGKLKWDTTIGEVFTGWVENIDPAWKDVTLEQLLSHRAGAPANLDADGLWGRLWERKGTTAQQRLQLVRGVLKHPPVVPPGSTYLYSNAGYAMAGAMAEVITGQPWEELLTEKVFQPLGITTGGFGAPGRPGLRDQPLGHDANGQPVTVGPKADNPPAIGPGATAHMAVGDWAKFVALHLRGDPANPQRATKLLKPESFAHLHVPKPGPGEPYAGGWLVTQRDWAKGSAPHATGFVLDHAGSNTMWFCVTWLAPERDFAVLVACNRGGDIGAKACDQIAGELIKQFNQ